MTFSLSAPCRRQQITWILALLLVASTGCKKEKADDSTTKTDQTENKQDKPPKSFDLEPGLVLMQKGKVQQAIDYFAKAETAESAYLRSIGFHRLKKHDAALAQIEIARKLDQDNSKYIAWEIVFRFSQQELLSANDLVKLAEVNPANAAITWASFYAHQVLRGLAEKHNNRTEADQHKELANAALRNSVDLAAAIPEFQRELLDMSVMTNQPQATDSLLKRLREVSPDDDTLNTQKIVTRLKQNEDPQNAIRDQAAQQYKAAKETEAAAVKYGFLLARMQASRENDTAFLKLVLQHRQSKTLREMLVLYFSQTQRFTRALQELDLAIQEISNEKDRQELLLMAVMMPIDRGDQRTAENQMNLYQEQIVNPWMKKYLQGRLLHLKRQRLEAIKLFKEVGTHQVKTAGPNDTLAREALLWAAKVEAEHQALQEGSD